MPEDLYSLWIIVCKQKLQEEHITSNAPNYMSFSLVNLH